MAIFSKEHKALFYRSRLISGAMIGLMALTLVGCGSQASKARTDPDSTRSAQAQTAPSVSGHDRAQSIHANLHDSNHPVATKQAVTHKSTKKRKHRTKALHDSDKNGASLSRMNYQSGQAAFIDINDGKSTLDPASWKVDNVDYANLDGLNRASNGNTAYLDKQNVANDSLRTSQTFQPTGYRQKFISRRPILNRGHEIAYSLSKGISANGRYDPKSQSGDQNNPKNLFTQTAFSNQRVQTIYESKVRNALKQGKKVIYQVRPVFNGNDLMAKGVQMQAISTDRSLDYNVYLYNVQPGMKFDYATGRSQVDHHMNVPTPAGAPTFHDSTSHSTTKNGYQGHTKKHHYVRYAAIAGAAHHVIKRHYQKKYGVAKHHHAIRNAVIGGFAVHEAHKHL